MIRNFASSPIRLFCLIIFLFILLPVSAFADVAIDAVMNTANGHYYYVYKMRMTPAESQSYCESQGGYLATITNQEEQNFVEGLAASSGLTHVTLGGTDLGHEGTWVWMNGETWGYSNWDPGEPNNGHGNAQSYLQLYLYNGKWDDFYGGWDNFTDIKDRFVCEWGDISVDLKVEVLERLKG